MWPDVTVIVLTYQRADLVKQCIEHLRTHLQYDADKLHWLVADDCSGVEQQLKRAKGFKDVKFTSTAENGGFGANYNNAVSAIETDLYFFIESDYLLTRPLDLRAGVALLETRRNIGILRYRATAGEHMVYHQFESDITDYLPDYREGVGLHGKLTYLQLDSGAPALYLWTNGAHLARRSAAGFYLPYPQHGKLGELEESMAHQTKDRMKWQGAPALAILPEWIPMYFDHVAPTYQNTDLDKGW